MVGEADVGKTCSIQAYMDNKFVTKQSISPKATKPEGVVREIYVPAQESKHDVYD